MQAFGNRRAGSSRRRRAAAAVAAGVVLASALGGPPTASAATARPALDAGPGVTALSTGSLVLLPQRSFTVTGTVAGGTPGAAIRLRLSGPVEPASARAITLSAGGAFSARLRTTRSGAISIAAGVGRGPAGAPLRATVIPTAAQPGDAGLQVRFLTERLRDLGYAVRVTDGYDTNTARAVLTFRKVNEMQRIGTASPLVFDRLAHGRGGYQVRFPGHGRHVEGDLTHQVLALVGADGRLAGVYHTSTGRPGFRTPTGSFRFWRQELGENSRGMVDSSFFSFTQAKTKTRPYRPACAIHGYFVVPTIPRSHCCFRVDNADARQIRLWIHIGNRFDIFGKQNGLP